MQVLHTTSFVNRWREMLVDLYAYQRDAGALLVPSIWGAKTAVYLPLLSYSDLSKEGAATQLEKMSSSRYQIRFLNSDCQDFLPNDTVTMRLALAGRSAEEIFRKIIDPKCRNHIRKSEKSGLTLRDGVDKKTIDDFFDIFAATMHRHGTPVFSKKLFELLPRFADTRYWVAYHGTHPVAALCLVCDEKLAWVPWAGSLFEHRALRPNHSIYWSAIQHSINAGGEIFDFGRSGFLGPTYEFKADWGALPVKVEVLTAEKMDVYQKYSKASDIWKKMPRRLVDTVGPVLCKYLPDL